MTEHRATSNQWSGIERFARYGAYDSCIIELRDRVEALEAAQRAIASPSSNRTHLGLTQDAPESSDSLVPLLAKAFTPREAILTVANWLDQQHLHVAATRLWQEAQ